MSDQEPLHVGDVLVTPGGVRWTVVPGSRLTSNRGLRKIRSQGGAIRWVHPRDVAGWTRQPIA